MDGTLEDKIYAPGYGESRAGVASADELYNAALALPVDALSGPVPRNLTRLQAGAVSILETARSRN